MNFFINWNKVLKLKHFLLEAPTIETEYRLKKWLTQAQGSYAEWSIRGSQDAIEYYESVEGDYDKLKLSFEWDWLKNYYKTKY